MNGIYRRSLGLCLGMLLLAVGSARAEDAVNRAKIVAGDVLVDAGQFVKDRDIQIANVASVDADRNSMAIDLNNSTALQTDVLNFFGDRNKVDDQEDVVTKDRRQLRVDVKPHTGSFQNPPKGSKDLSTAVKQFFTDFDARVAAEAALDTDYSNLKISVLAQDKAGVTSNANAFFHDRHAFFQDRLDEAQDVHSIKKILKFRGQKAALTKPVKGKDLKAHASQFLSDRAKRLTDADAITTARNNMRSAVNGGSNLSDAVTAWLNARRTHFIDALQLDIDRFAMKVDVGLAKRHRHGGNNGRGEGAEDSNAQPQPSLDESDEDNGETK